MKFKIFGLMAAGLCALVFGAHRPEEAALPTDEQFRKVIRANDIAANAS